MAKICDPLTVELRLNAEQFNAEIERCKGQARAIHRIFSVRGILLRIAETACVVAIWELGRFLFG